MKNIVLMFLLLLVCMKAQPMNERELVLLCNYILGYIKQGDVVITNQKEFQALKNIVIDTEFSKKVQYGAYLKDALKEFLILTDDEWVELPGWVKNFIDAQNTNPALGSNESVNVCGGELTGCYQDSSLEGSKKRRHYQQAQVAPQVKRQKIIYTL